MAQTTTGPFDGEKIRDGQEPVLLLEMQLTGETLYLSNRALTVDGQAYTELMSGGVEIEQSGAFSPGSQGGPQMGQAQIRLVNGDDVTGTPFSDKLATRTFTNRRAILRQEYIDADGDPLALADALTMIDGPIELAQDGLFSETEFRLDVVDGSDAWHQDLGTPVDTDFSEAPPESVSKIQPIIYGSIDRHVCVPVDIGGRTTLRSDIAIDATTIPLSDADGFSASGSILVDAEEIAYTAISSNDLTGATRASGGTTAVAHLRGASAVQVQAQIDYLVAGHAVKTISAVYIRPRGGSREDWVLLDAGDYTALTDSGGKALIRFDAQQLLQRAVAIIAPSIEHLHDVTGLGNISAPAEYPPGESFPQTLGGAGLSVNKTYTFTPHDPPAVAGFWYFTRSPSMTTPVGSQWRISVGAFTQTYDYPNGPPFPFWLHTGEYTADSITIQNLTANAEITLTAVYRGLSFTPQTTPTAAQEFLAGREQTDTIYNLEVAVDVEGFADDGGGTYTGSAGGLIIRPADILRHIGGVLLGWSVADRFDATTFNAARIAEGGAGVRLDFALRDRINSKILFEMIREQSMSAHLLTAEGKYKRWLAPFFGSVLKHFDETDDILAPIAVGLTSLAEVRNIIGIRYQPDPSSADSWAYVEKTDATSQGTGNPPTPGYNVTKRWLAEFGLLRDATAADWVATQWLAWLKDQHYLARLVVRPEWIHLEPWDHVGITSTRMPGDWSNKECIVQSVIKRLGDPLRADEIELLCRAVA